LSVLRTAGLGRSAARNDRSRVPWPRHRVPGVRRRRLRDLDRGRRTPSGPPPPSRVPLMGRRRRTGLGGWSWTSFCKTQYAAKPEVGGVANFLKCHLAVIGLLDAAKAIGFAVEVVDEGDYWEQRDTGALRGRASKGRSHAAAPAKRRRRGASRVGGAPARRAGSPRARATRSRRRRATLGGRVCRRFPKGVRSRSSGTLAPKSRRDAGGSHFARRAGAFTGAQGSSNVAAEAAAAWDARRQSDKRRAEEEIERVRQGYAPGAPTATVEPPWPSPPKAGKSPIDRMKRKSELDQQRRERIDRVMKARAARSTVGEQGDSGG
jgi:hypothetical protein